ncbi:MAG: hypothetical protein K0S32_827 [Bacteroidetes bacterium]|jgi:hypothetical protein|nr:hypothetical protein [Bacteroidota bacterium]
MFKYITIFFAFLFSTQIYFSQTPAAQDTIFLMTGHVVGEKVIDTLLGAVTIMNPDKPEKKLHYEWEQLYMVKFADGYKRFYYRQDSLLSNWFTRDEMWMFMKGERDARKGFKARGSLIGAGVAGLIGGLSGTFFAPVAPYGYMALTGIPKVRIKHKTISDPRNIESDAYILGYERVARQKRKIQSIIGGTIGLAIGYGLYALFHQHYPEEIKIGFLK